MPTSARGPELGGGLHSSRADPPATPFERFGGHEFFDLLVARFYAGVAEDPVLRPMYPEADLGPAAERLQLFLEQYWGGPTTYSQERGHPRLRMRHAPYAVDARPTTPGCATCARPSTRPRRRAGCPPRTRPSSGTT